MNRNTKSVNYLESQKKLCEEWNVDFEKVKKVNSRMSLLLQKVVKIEKLVEVAFNVTRSMEYWQEIWNLSTSSAVNLTPKQKSLLELFSYLMLSEGVFSEVVQAIAFILMKSHHDIYDKGKFVKNYEALNEVPLSVKLKFIKRHGLEFIAVAYDKKLRNSIAHLGFIVNEDGSIVDRRTEKITKDVREKTDYLGCVCAVTIDAIFGLSQERIDKLKRH